MIRCDWWPECSAAPLWAVETDEGVAVCCDDHRDDAVIELGGSPSIALLGLLDPAQLRSVEALVWLFEGGPADGS